MKILVAEDDQFTRNGLMEIFRDEGYSVFTASDGKNALSIFKREQPDFVCLDVMMPGMDGYTVCQNIRKLNSDVPVMFITAKSDEIDAVVGLELGADDYIVKPFGIKEVTARVRAIMRRLEKNPPQQKKAGDEFRVGNVLVKPEELRCEKNEDSIDLNERDVALLWCLYKRKGKVCSRDQLFEAGWGYEHLPNSRTLDQHIAQLRKKIEDNPAKPVLIETIHGVGYRHNSSDRRPG